MNRLDVCSLILVRVTIIAPIRMSCSLLLMLSSVYDMIDKRVLPGRHIGHDVHRAQMSRAYRRHQGLVRLITFFYTRYSKFLFHFHFLLLLRLEARGWMVSPPPEGGSAGGVGDGSTIVLVKRSKKRMDQEHYLDATQRCVS
jgi:hypothetical protein